MDENHPVILDSSYDDQFKEPWVTVHALTSALGSLETLHLATCSNTREDYLKI